MMLKYFWQLLASITWKIFS